MDKDKIIQKYQQTILGNYYNGSELLADKISTERDLISAMYDLLSHELDLSDDGRNFIDEYWGFDRAAQLILDYEELDGDFHKRFQNKEAIIDWISHEKEYRLVSHEEEARLNIIHAFYKKYKNVKLGGLVGLSSREYYISQLSSEDLVVDFLVNLSKGISYLTLSGYEYLKDRYGFKNLATKLYEKYPEFSKGGVKENNEWLVYEKHDFIRK